MKFIYAAIKIKAVDKSEKDKFVVLILLLRGQSFEQCTTHGSVPSQGVLKKAFWKHADTLGLYSLLHTQHYS